MVTDPFAAPEDGHEARLAFGLLAEGRDLPLRILHELLQGPKRFRDLKRLVKGKSDTPLTRALTHLADEGLVRQGLDFSKNDDIRYYAPTGLGVAVVLKTHEFRPVAEVLTELRDIGALAS